MEDHLVPDILKHIFSFIHGKDLIECSKVNRKFYFASSDNRLWFEMIKQEGRKFIISNNPKFIYNDKMNYKILFLSMFNQSYHSQFISFYRESFIGVVFREGKWFEKLVTIPMFVVPAGILVSPFAFIIEVASLYEHKTKKNEYCGCSNCFQKLKDKLKLLKS
jgi:hypothetical protein